jgi:hypothetical protein
MSHQPLLLRFTFETADLLFVRRIKLLPITVLLELVIAIMWIPSVAIPTIITLAINRIRIPIVTIEGIMLARSTMPEILVKLVHTSLPLLAGTMTLAVMWTQHLHVVPLLQSCALLLLAVHHLVAMVVMIFAAKVAFVVMTIVVRNMLTLPMVEASSTHPVTLHAEKTLDAVISVAKSSAMVAAADGKKSQSGRISDAKNSDVMSTDAKSRW